MPRIQALSTSPSHSLSKANRPSLTLLTGIGVQGDAHAGETVKHRSHVRRDPSKANLRQVHLIHAELLDELAAKGFDISPGQMGENITTQGIDLLGLPTGTRLHLGDQAILQITGLRNPCGQLDGIQPGLMHALIEKRPGGEVIRKAGIMSIVLQGGTIRTGDPIRVELPPEPHVALEKV